MEKEDNKDEADIGFLTHPPGGPKGFWRSEF
jgi:hypothetical protein